MRVYAAWVEGGYVVRVGVFYEGNIPDDVIVIGEKNIVGIGWQYDGGQFVPPVYEISEGDAEEE